MQTTIGETEPRAVKVWSAETVRTILAERREAVRRHGGAARKQLQRNPSFRSASMWSKLDQVKHKAVMTAQGAA